MDEIRLRTEQPIQGAERSLSECLPTHRSASERLTFASETIGASRTHSADLREVDRKLSNRINVSPVLGGRSLARQPHVELDEYTSIVYNPKTEEFTYICKAPPKKNLVISGGGAKGGVIPGFIQASEDYHEIEGGESFRDQLEHLAGSSVGAISCALMAAGMPSQALVKALGGVKFKSLLGKGLLLKDGRPLEEFIRLHLIESTTANLCHLCKKRSVEELCWEAIPNKEKITRDEFDTLINGLTKSPFSLTFAMLDTLHRIDSKKFKKLTTTATCRETGQTFYFDAKSTPHLDIATACRASASLPIILKPVSIEKSLLAPGYAKEGCKGVLTFVDGGYLDNIPVGVFENKKEGFRGEAGQNPQTLVLIFDEAKKPQHLQSPFFDHQTRKHALYNSSNLLERLIRDVFAKVFARIRTKERNTVKKEEGLHIVASNYTQGHIPFDIGDVKTNDFDKSERLQGKLYEKGYLQSLEYFSRHEGELMATTFDSFEELLTHVSLDELLSRVPIEKRAKMVEEINAFRKKVEGRALDLPEFWK